MKVFASVALLAFLFAGCNANKVSTAKVGCYKGRLEIKGMCFNYTIKLVEGTMEKGKVEPTWTDEVTKKTYTNVFALGSPCDFPAKLQVGDEFYFTLTDSAQTCPVCMAYYPTPQKKLAIKVLDKPCN